MAEAIGVVMALIGLWWVATHGKGTATGRLVAWGAMVIVVWGLVAVNDVSTATTMAGDTARGIVTATKGFSEFMRALLT